MQVKRKKRKTLRLLGKWIVGLLILLFAGLLFLHTPYFQKRLSKKIPSLLSEAIGAKVELENLTFSLLGCIRIEGLEIWDPEDNKIFSVQALDLRFSPRELLSGQIHVKRLDVQGVYGLLSEDAQGDMNILFITDAFSGGETSSSPSRPMTIQIDSVLLKQFDLAYHSIPDRLSVSSRMENISITEINVKSEPMTVRLDDFVVSQHQLDILIESGGTTDTIHAPGQRIDFQFPSPGLKFFANHIGLKEHAISFHRDSVTQPEHFDPDHITLDSIFLDLSDVRLDNNAISCTMSGLSGQLPGFDLVHAGAELHWNQKEIGVRQFNARSEKSQLEADCLLAINEAANASPGSMHLTSSGRVNTEEISFFLPDTISRMIHHIPGFTFKMDLHPATGSADHFEMEIETNDSRASLSGQILEIWNPDKLAWKEVVLQTDIGNDVKNVITELSGETGLPPGKIEALISSSGNPDKLNLDGLVQTGWGDVDLKGEVILYDDEPGFSMRLIATDLQAGPYLDFSWLGKMNGAFDVVKASGSHQPLTLDGRIVNIEIDGNTINDIDINAFLETDSLMTNIRIHDAHYTSDLALLGHLDAPMQFDADLRVDTFNVGRLIGGDSTFLFSGRLHADLLVDGEYLQVKAEGKQLELAQQEAIYSLDSMDALVVLSPDSSEVAYRADDGYVNLLANFDLKESSELFKSFSDGNFLHKVDQIPSLSHRRVSLEGEISEPGIFRFAGVPIDSFSSVLFDWLADEASHAIRLNVHAGPATLLGASVDTINATLSLKETDIHSQVNAGGFFFQSHKMGDLAFEVSTTHDTIHSFLQMVNDTNQVLRLALRAHVHEDSLSITPEQLVFYNRAYQLDVPHPIEAAAGGIDVHQLSVSLDEMMMSIDGNQDSLSLKIDNVDLAHLNPLLFTDSTIIDSGTLNGSFSFVRGKTIDLEARINQLVLLGADPLTIDARAETRNGEVPFDFHLTNGSSNVDMVGLFAIDQSTLDASLTLDMDSLQMFRAFYQSYLEALDGAVRGEAKVSGSLKEPVFDGYLEFSDVSFTTLNPKIFFQIKEDRLRFSDKGISLSDFVIYDNVDNPLYVSGSISNEGYKTMTYDLHVNTDRYALINKPLTSDDGLKGLFVLGADIRLQGKGQDADIDAKIVISDTTNIVLTLPEKQNQLLSTSGIIEFVDPEKLLDTTWIASRTTTYDSLIAGLPGINLKSTVQIKEKAALTIITDPQSGDYFNVAGKANLELTYDRTQNPSLVGTYEVTRGVYSLSFYNLVKKDFELVPGSTIHWTGSPEEGALDIHAAYTIQSNSIGLVGHEVGDNEQSVYKKSLPYEVGIDISGTIKTPQIKFTLDLPEEEKITYPVLASKLSRLQQPEFQSELNKQVFGLLVIGGFIPETSGATGGQSDIATTALYNSVNSLLSAQLNRFANQYIKGVNIDVGIQSYNDYASNGGKTKTSMDFHLTKSLLNDRLVVEVGGDFDIGSDQSGANQGNSYRGDMAIIYDLTGNGDRKLKFFNNESYDIIYQEIRNTGIALIFVREFNKGELKKRKEK